MFVIDAEACSLPRRAIDDDGRGESKTPLNYADAWSSAARELDPGPERHQALRLLGEVQVGGAALR
jgi:hypothetical protein